MCTTSTQQQQQQGHDGDVLRMILADALRLHGVVGVGVPVVSDGGPLGPRAVTLAPRVALGVAVVVAGLGVLAVASLVAVEVEALRGCGPAREARPTCNKSGSYSRPEKKGGSAARSRIIDTSFLRGSEADSPLLHAPGRGRDDLRESVSLARRVSRDTTLIFLSTVLSYCTSRLSH